MRNHCFVALGVALVVGFMIAEAQGRPGGRRGGGSRVGGARSGYVRPGNIGATQRGLRNFGGKLADGNFQNKVSRLKTNFTPANQPFTPAWYADHPRAWQLAHPHADVWAVATFGVAATWLGIAATTPGDAADSGTVYTSETDASSAPEGEFLPLGVFALAPKSERDASAVVQLAVNRQGRLRGNYYDVLTGRDQAVVGKIDQKTRRATFAVSPKGNVSFETTLASLTRPTGSVTLHFHNGTTRQWTLARFDNPAPPAPARKR